MPSVSHLPVLNEEEGERGWGAFGKTRGRTRSHVDVGDPGEGRRAAAVWSGPLAPGLLAIWHDRMKGDKRDGISVLWGFDASGFRVFPALLAAPLSPPFISPHPLTFPITSLPLCLQFGVKVGVELGAGCHLGL